LSRYAGVDPGKTAGACVVIGDDGARVLAVQYWEGAETPPVLSCLDGVGVAALELPYHGEDPHAALVLAHWCGWMHRDLHAAGIEVAQPLAVSWRAKVLRIGRVTRAVAKAKAIDAAQKHAIGMPPEFRESPDVSEAWCLARWCWGWVRAGRPALARTHQARRAA
jgi:hypothetical protein